MKYVLSTALIIIFFAFGGCKRDTELFDGPSLIDRFGDFDVLEGFSANRETVSFSEGETVQFAAEFNKNVDWIIEITGQTSGAVKRITGFDRIIEASNATWNGGTTDLPFFREENCSVTLRVPEEPEFLGELEITITSPKQYEGSLFIDFETDPGAAIELGNFEFEFSPQTGRRNDIQAAQGEFYYLLEGTDNVVPNFFVGLINISPSVTGNTYAPVPTNVPSQLHFNCFLWHDAGPHCIAVIQFAYDSNNSGSFEDGVDQVFQIEGDYPLNHNGWRHIHHTMADVGMNAEQVEQIVAIRVLLISNNNTQPNPPVAVRFGIDYLTFTQGAKLQL